MTYFRGVASPSIFIVEDEPIIAADLQDRLVDMGYDIQGSADNGEEALRLLEDRQPSLILMDVNLAGELDGVQTATQVMERWGTPLIFLTSNSDGPTFRRARAVKPKAFLSKPFRGRDLRHAIELALDIGEDVAPPIRRAKLTIPDGESAAILDDRLFIKVKERLTRIMLSDVLYVAADDYYCRVHTEERDYLVTKTLKKFVDLLPPGAPFARCHRSYIVNLRRITEIGELFVFLGKHQLPVSRSRRHELLRRVKNP